MMRSAAHPWLALGTWLMCGCFGAPLFRGNSDHFTGLEFKNSEARLVD
jgi:hypothetical protein